MLNFTIVVILYLRTFQQNQELKLEMTYVLHAESMKFFLGNPRGIAGPISCKEQKE